MRHVRFSIGETSPTLYGVIEGDQILEYTGDRYTSMQWTGQSYPLAEAILHAPLIPKNIIGIGKNFFPEGSERPDIPEMPILFFKPLTCLIGPDEPILLPPGMYETKFESELAVVIGKPAKRISPEEASDVIFGYTVANDVGATQYFHPEGHWTIGKSFDTFCPVGPWIDTEFDAHSAHIFASVNGVEKQNCPIEQMIMPIDQLISYVSFFMTLMPGDLLLTGTPPGADVIRDGDTIVCEIKGLGRISNPVRRELA